MLGIFVIRPDSLLDSTILDILGTLSISFHNIPFREPLIKPTSPFLLTYLVVPKTFSRI